MDKAKKRNMKLEKEFTQQVEIHKISIVEAGFQLFEKDIYKHKFVEKISDNSFENISNVVYNLYSNDYETFNNLYEFCWKKISKVLPDSQTF